MESVIIGVYDELAHARSAKNELIASGFARSLVQLNPDHEISASMEPPAEPKDPPLSASIGNLFRSLFNMDAKSAYSNLYGEAVRRGGYVLTVEVDNDERRVRAREIMARYGGVHLDERSADWVRHGWRGHDPQAADAAEEKAARPSNADSSRAGPRASETGEPD